MSYTLIKGTFFPNLGVPDGDSVRFRADDLSLFDQLQGTYPEIKDEDTVQLRYEGIDAVEKEAIKSIADASLKANLSKLDKRGYILSSHTDNTSSHRPISFVYSGDTNTDDGKKIFLDKDMLRKSVNYQMVEEGWAYVMFYRTLYSELRITFKEAFVSARKHKLGIHQSDVSMKGVAINSKKDLATIPPIFPKLWRRLKDYLSRNHGLTGFPNFLKKRKDKLFTLNDGRYITFDNCLEVKGNSIKLIYEPFDMLFEE